MSVLQCSVISCNNKSVNGMNIGKHFSLFNFPRDPKLLQKWIEFTGRSNLWKPGIIGRICSEHFMDNAFLKTKLEGLNDRKILKVEAIPTIASIEYLSGYDNNTETAVETSTQKTNPHKRKLNSRASVSSQNSDNLSPNDKRRSKKSDDSSGSDFLVQYLGFVGDYKTGSNHTSPSASESTKQKQSTSPRPLIEQCASEEEHSDIEMEENDLIDDQESSYHSSPANETDTEEDLTKKLHKKIDRLQSSVHLILRELKSIRSELKAAQPSSPIKKVEVQHPNGLTCFPIGSSAEFQEFDKICNNSNNIRMFIKKKLESCRETDHKIFLHQNLNSLLTKNVSKSLIWNGANVKFTIQDSVVIKILKECTMENFPLIAESNIMAIIRNWFCK